MISERVQYLVERYIVDLLTEEEKAELTKWLDEDPGHRALFREAIELEFHLDSQLSAPDEDEKDKLVDLQKAASLGWLGKWEHVGVAALLMICLTFGWMLWSNRVRPTEEGTGASDSFAKLSSVSSDVVFREDYELPRKEGSYLGKGWVLLDRGTVEIEFHSGAQVAVIGPAVFGIDTEMRSYLDSGKVTVHAPGVARDFVVATESMEVVDLGTRFEVEVDPKSRESNVSVIEGLVDLHLGSRGTKRMIRPLEAGYAARVDAYGRIVEITSRPGSHPGTGGGDAAILAHWTFDEIGADGRVEDRAGDQLDGVLQPGKRPKFVTGASGKALKLSAGEAVDLREHVSTLGQLEDFALTAWVRDPGKPLAMLFSYSGETEQHRVQFLLFPQHIDFGWQDGPHYDAISGRVDGWVPGQWYHVAMTARGGLVRLYRDGELIAFGSMGSRIGMPVSSPSRVNNASHAYLGRLEDGRQGEATSHQWFDGEIDDFQIYSGALSHEGIQFVFEHPGEVWTPEVARQ